MVRQAHHERFVFRQITLNMQLTRSPSTCYLLARPKPETYPLTLSLSKGRYGLTSSPSRPFSSMPGLSFWEGKEPSATSTIYELNA